MFNVYKFLIALPVFIIFIYFIITYGYSELLNTEQFSERIPNGLNHFIDNF